MTEIVKSPSKSTVTAPMAVDDCPWGRLLMIDCFGCSEEICCDLDKGYEFLDKICVFLGMTKQTQPYIFKTCEVVFPGLPGFSGWVPIIESGIQIHTSGKNRFVSIDVYSCKEFDQEKVEEFVIKWFEPDAIDSQLCFRGCGYLNRSFNPGPRSIPQKLAI